MFRFFLVIAIFLSLQSLYGDGHDLDVGRIEYEKNTSEAGFSGVKHDFKVFTYKGYILVITRFLNVIGSVCLPSDLTNDQALSIVGEYVQKPAKSNPSAAVVIFDALDSAYPCSASDKKS
jgi:hypothetical protein